MADQMWREAVHSEAAQSGLWKRAIALDALTREGRAVVKIGGRQIALFLTQQGVRACNNRCPHEGYPLREGTLDERGILTCNWHSWRFDLCDGANLRGRDRLRIYPVRIVAGEVWVDVADPPAAILQATALENLRGAFEKHQYDRISRELARFLKAGGDGASAVTAAIRWSHERLEFGMTHAYAGAAGWLTLHDESDASQTRLVALTEAIAGISFDVLREPAYSYPGTILPWDAAAFRMAVEVRDETAAIGRLRGALAQGLHFMELEPVLAELALLHYAAFGHSVIYLIHVGRLISRLGIAVEEPLLLALTRALIHASHEDLIPGFRGYASMLRDWPLDMPSRAQKSVGSEAFRGRSIEATMSAVLEAAAHCGAEALYDILFAALARNLLEFDTRWEANTKGPVAQNVGWLDFTHGLTFSSAARQLCAKYPALWPAALLQMACFLGRNTGFTTPESSPGSWRVADRSAFYDGCRTRICDHGKEEYIVAIHLLKTFLAVRAEMGTGLSAEAADTALAALNRFLNTPMKRKHVQRTASQSARFVAIED